MRDKKIAVGVVESLCINGQNKQKLKFDMHGPIGDCHASHTRKLSGHDGAYMRTSGLGRGDSVFNWRTWTGISTEEIGLVEKKLNVTIPPGCLLENIQFSGIPNFSQLAPTSRLVFPSRNGKKLILAVWEQNGPCKTVGVRLARMHNKDESFALSFVKAAAHKRGVMGFVLSEGSVGVGSIVEVYPPAEYPF